MAVRGLRRQTVKSAPDPGKTEERGYKLRQEASTLEEGDGTKYKPPESFELTPASRPRCSVVPPHG